MDGRHATLPPEPVAPTYSVVVNIPVGAMNKTNGAIQILPGSHCIRPVGGGPRVPEALESLRAKVEPSIQPDACVGDVLIRDIRLWHRGVPNPSDRPRHMIALIVTDGRHPVRHQLEFQVGCEDALEGHSVESNAKYAREDIDYLIEPTRRIYRNIQAAREKQEVDKSQAQD